MIDDEINKIRNQEIDAQKRFCKQIIAPAASNTGKEENIDPENNELTQRLHRLSESWTAEREDHKGRCRTLDILLGVEGLWLFDLLYRCQETLKNLSVQKAQLQKRNGELEIAISSWKKEEAMWNEFQLQDKTKIADLEKRNAELEKELAIKAQYLESLYPCCTIHHNPACGNCVADQYNQVKDLEKRIKDLETTS